MNKPEISPFDLATLAMLEGIAGEVNAGEFSKATATAAMMAAGELAIIRRRLSAFLDSVHSVEVAPAPRRPVAKETGSVN